jgi:hypothetical protein
MKTQRSQIRRALVPRTRIRAADFLNELGYLMRPGEWSPSCVQHLKSNEPKKLNQVAQTHAHLVVNNLIEAAELGIAKAEILLTQQHLSELFPEKGKIEIDDFSYSWDEVYPPLPGHYPVDGTYWRNAFPLDNVDWVSSLAKLHVKYIIFSEYVERQMKAAGHVFNDQYIRNVPLYIMDPDDVLASACDVPPVPTCHLVSRYRTTQRYFWAELVAVAWRFLAAEGRKDDRGLAAKLIGHLYHYIQIQGLYEHEDSQGPSEPMMKNVVRQILDQWRGGETDASVLVSPSPARNGAKEQSR